MVKKCLFCGRIWCDPPQEDCPIISYSECDRKCGHLFSDEQMFRQEKFRFDICEDCAEFHMDYFEYQFGGAT